MCKNRIGQLLALSLLAVTLTACGQKGDLFLSESESETAVSEKQAPEEQDPKDGPIMDEEKASVPEGKQETEQQTTEPQGDQL